MKSIGIIAEYNPFTNGHLYHLNTIKDMYPEHTIILVMNGHFTERGDVSVINKWKRTEIALRLGVDLVVELPFPFATQSADFFAYGAITLLEKLKVEKVIFGSESNNIKDLEEIAKIQVDNDELEKLVKVYSKLGANYPTALSNAIYDLTGKRIDTPNDLLGISYIKTIIKNNYNIIPESIERTNSYHDSIESATNIRRLLKEDYNVDKYIPKEVKFHLQDLHFLDDYFDLLKYKIITEKDLTIYQTVEEGIENLLKKEITNSYSLEEFISKIKSKRYTHNKIKRMLIHILCNFTKEKAKNMKEITYIRLLGFNSKGKEYLNQIKKDIDIPIISKITREKDPMLEYEIETTKIYDIPTKENCTKQEFDKIINI
ncbi:MAG: nucleotidyltransferase [Bacilli bacterium]|nr:nucleotidyltransferase [Bacilli bacterium]MBR6136645.1 nucleotidyltransferase [Bacilli bacterium]